MLRELHIANLALIEDLRLELAEGLNCFTGQTGAGKSLIIGAFEILLGLRRGTDYLRPGAEEARVTGVFALRHPAIAEQVALLLDQPIDPDDDLLITRKVFASGRSSFSVNGQPATAAMVKAVGELLVDVHGQHEHQSLLKPSHQLAMLDAFGRCTDQRRRFAELHGALRDARRRRHDLAGSATLRRQQLELYEFQADEIDAADPAADEFQQLQARHGLLGNLKRIKTEAGQAHAALHESEGSILERLQMAAHILCNLAEIDEDLKDTAEQIRISTLTLQDAAFDLGRYVDRLDLDPAELAEIEDRLNTLNRLIDKYGGDGLPDDDPIAAVLAFREQIGDQIQQLRGQTADLETIDRQIAEFEVELTTVGTQLAKARRAAADRLRPLVEAQLHELGMAESQLHVEFESMDVLAEDAPAGGGDAVELMIRTNPGQPARPLRQIASGGELSRIMLALKSILADADRVSVLVFDEVDANVGGRMGEVIGRKLKRLADGGEDAAGAHQVLCITHLPQIAAFADRHVHVAKAVEGTGKDRQTRTTVAPLDGKQRVEELAAMLAGAAASATTRKQARELLQTAGA